jgi:hypothetical protein
VGRLSLLPSESAPVLSFLGATEGEAGAVFLVTGGAKQSGKGSCRPKGDSCRFLTLKPGETQFLDYRPKGGELYQIRLIRMRREYLRRGDGKTLADFVRLGS